MPTPNQPPSPIGQSGAVAVFRDDDVGYMAWLQANPRGFVLNAASNPSADYVILHRADCYSITQLQPGANNWTKDFLKACSRSATAIEAWTQREVHGPPQRCGHCWQPTSRR